MTIDNINVTKIYNMENLIDYINWEQIVRDHNLKSGDLTPTQEGDLKDIITNFITTNK